MSRPEFRRAQGIVPFGVGAIIDFPDESLMAAGLDAWPIQAAPDQTAALREATRVSEPRLQARLRRLLDRPITEMFMPPEAPPQSGQPFAPAPGPVLHSPTPFVRFPEWHFCPRCRAMQRVPWNTPSRDSRMHCANPRFRRQAKQDTRPCSELPSRRRPRLVPVRFIMACRDGHISDFPWVLWAHSGVGGCGEDRGTLFLVSTGGAGLDGLRVECARCGEGRTMRGAFNPDQFAEIAGVTCPGDRPWLGPEAREDCQARQVQVVQRGASNVYFPQIVSSILIPPHSETLHRILDNPAVWSDIRDAIDAFRVNGEPRIEPAMFRARAARYGIDLDTFTAAVREKYLHPDRWAGEVDESENAYRHSERQAFLGPRPAPNERDEFDLCNIDISHYGEPVGNLFSHIILLPRLRETRALIGFTRIVPPESAQERLASLSLGRLNWVPAVSVSGEGIYFELNAERLAKWERAHATISDRVRIVNERARTVATERGTAFTPYARRLLLAHTLSHLIIRQLSFDCGYDSSSLKERLYVSDDAGQEMCGVLIYTASGDSEGSLGGLVRQGEPGRFEATVAAAVQNAEFCASDPLCLESTGQGYYGMNLAACHACALLPETACELGNRLLDRAQIVGSCDYPEGGFFSAHLQRDQATN